MIFIAIDADILKYLGTCVASAQENPSGKMELPSSLASLKGDDRERLQEVGANIRGVFTEKATLSATVGRLSSQLERKDEENATKQAELTALNGALQQQLVGKEKELTGQLAASERGII